MAKLNQSKQEGLIIGILSEAEINYGSFTNKTTHLPEDSIKGVIKILVEREIKGEMVSNIIPVSVFSKKLTGRGTINPSYSDIEKVAKEMTSIAAAGSKEGADVIQVTGLEIEQNEYYNKGGKLSSYPKIKGSFFKAVVGDYTPVAEVVFNMYLMGITPAVDKEGVELEPKKLLINGSVPNYKGEVNLLDVVAVDPNVIDVIKLYWTAGDTFRLKNRIMFNTETKTVVDTEVDFGEPVERTQTFSTSEVVIIGGSKTPLTGGEAYTKEEMTAGLEQRKAVLDKGKSAALAGQSTNNIQSAPGAVAAGTNPANAAATLGF